MHLSTSNSDLAVANRSGLVRLTGSLLLCVLLFLVADRLFSAALWSCISQSGFRFSVLYRRRIDAAIVVLGNSRGMALVNWPYVESRTHRKLFSLSYNAISSPLSELLFEDYLDRNRVPAVLLIEVTQVMSDETLIQELKLYKRASSRIRDLLEVHYPWLDWGTRISNLYAFNGEMLLRNLYYLKRSDHDWLIDGNLTPGVLAEAAALPKQFWRHPDPVKLDALVRIVRLAKSRGTKVRLVVGPYLPQFLGSVVNAEDIFHEIGSRTGEPIIDYSNAIADPADFSDRIHINRRGAQIITRRMIADGVFD